jgi:oligoribonuclease NrnB/cAMP/cGMP phosphodiesterase (DHH superfamily)
LKIGYLSEFQQILAKFIHTNVCSTMGKIKVQALKCQWMMNIRGYGIQRHIQQYSVAVRFIGEGGGEKTIDMSRVTDTLYQLMVYFSGDK